MDIIIIIVLLLVMFFFVRKINSIVYFIPIIDIGLRIINFLKSNINSPEISDFLNSYLPTSIPSVVDKYTTGVLNEVIIWVYVVIFIIFEIKLIGTFLKRK